MIWVNDVAVKAEKYPDGTPKITIKDIPYEEAIIRWNYEPGEEMTLYHVAQHLRETMPKKSRRVLVMPYVPNARMDRVKNPNEVFTLRHFCEFINSLEFDSVAIRDAHSSVSLALLNNVAQTSISPFVRPLIEDLLDIRKDIIFYPDEGSCKRYTEMFTFPYAFGIKNRDWKTGKIENLDVMGLIPRNPFNVLIIDDISSYGGTFLFAARKLKEMGAEDIYLYVTHCENSILDGELIKSGLLKRIYTTDSIFTGSHLLITVLQQH